MHINSVQSKLGRHGSAHRHSSASDPDRHRMANDPDRRDALTGTTADSHDRRNTFYLHCTANNHDRRNALLLAYLNQHLINTTLFMGQNCQRCRKAQHM